MRGEPTVTTLDGLYNFRDTGGLPLQGGGTSRTGVLFRSEALGGLTDQGVTQLAETEIGVVVDLRTSTERDAAPDRLPGSRPFDTVRLAIAQGAIGDPIHALVEASGRPSSGQPRTGTGPLPALGDLYVWMLQQSAAAFAEVARIVAASHDSAPTAVVVHCTAGKDRTGVAVALVLDAVGVERTAVVDDYAQSERRLAGPWSDGMIHMIQSLGVDVTPQLRTLVTETPPSAIRQALAWTDAAGGSAEYLMSGGLTPRELDTVRRRLAG